MKKVMHKLRLIYRSGETRKRITGSDVSEKILSFTKLPEGWHFGSGSSPHNEIIDIALRIVEQATLWSFDVDAFPGIEGEILVALYYGNKSLELTVENSGRVTLVQEENDREIACKHDLTSSDALREVMHFGELWNTSESFTSSTTTRGKAGLRAWPLRTRVTAQVFPSSPSLVYARSAPPFVDTYARSTRAYRRAQQYFGSSPFKSCRADAAWSQVSVPPVTFVTAT